MYRSLISLMPKAQPLLLDLYPNAAVAFSLRKLRTAYSGSAIRVRRSSDNTEQDIGFISNNLDTASLLTFCGAGNGFVTTWYDQSTNGNNATQATAGNQPRIVNGGVVETVNGKNGIRWLTSPNNVMLCNTSIQELHNGSNSLVISLVTSTTSSTSAQAIIATCQNLSSNRGYHLRMFTNPGNINSTIRNGTSTLVSNNITTNIYPNNNQYLIIDKIDSSNITLADRSILNINGSSDINNNSENGTPSTSNSTRTLMIGALLNDTFFRGVMQEIIIYPTDQSSNRTAIETNINSHYNVY
jgi:hypothetical protein